jgi:hypothetical protein
LLYCFIFARTTFTLKKLFAFILLLCFAVQTFSQAVIRLNFYMQQAYIAKNLCENRYRPMLHCDGKCVLAKKLKQEQKKDQQTPERKMQGKEEVVSSRSFFTANLLQLASGNIIYPVSSNSTIVDRSADIFHPPC